MLGIIIGIMAVIVLVSVMNGLTGEVTDMFNEIGTTSIDVYKRQCKYNDEPPHIEQHIYNFDNRYLRFRSRLLNGFGTLICGFYNLFILH